MLKDEFQYYIKNQGELVKKFNGRFLVIKDQTVVGDFDNQQKAYDDAVSKYELGSFLIQLCASGEGNYTQTFHSRVINSFVS